jgi:hypothetical protein
MRQYCLLYPDSLYSAGSLPLSFYLCLVRVTVYRTGYRSLLFKYLYLAIHLFSTLLPSQIKHLQIFPIMTPHDRSLSNTSDASYYVGEQLDIEHGFPSPLNPLVPAGSFSSIPSASSAGRGKEVIQEEEAKGPGNGWDDILTMLTQSTYNAPVASDRNPSKTSERSVRLTKKSEGI